MCVLPFLGQALAVVDQRLGLSEAASAAEQRMQLSEKASQLSQKVQAADLRLQISAKAQELSQDWQAFRDKAEPWMSWTLIFDDFCIPWIENVQFD